MSASTKESLQDQLDRITQNTRALVQPERLAVSEKATEDLFNTGIEDRILKAGSQAPSFTLEDALTHKPVSSADLLALGPLVVNFFRGRWDPYCITELESWRDLQPELRKRNALFVAISPQTTRQNNFTLQQHSLPYPLLSDHNATDASWRLPLPAVFVIDRTNTITFAEAHADFRVRPEPADILAALDQLN